MSAHRSPRVAALAARGVAGHARVDLDAFEIDLECQARVTLEEDLIFFYAERMAEGDKFPPAVAFFDGEKHWLADGWHRLLSHGVNKRKFPDDKAWATMECEVRTGSRDDAIRFALAANATHGKQREFQDYQKAFHIAVTTGLVGAIDTVAVRAVLRCSDRMAERLTRDARDEQVRLRDAKIVELGRDRARLSQREIADKVGSNQATVSRVMRQPHPPPVHQEPDVTASLVLWSNLLEGLRVLNKNDVGTLMANRRRPMERHVLAELLEAQNLLNHIKDGLKR